MLVKGATGVNLLTWINLNPSMVHMLSKVQNQLIIHSQMLKLFHTTFCGEYHIFCEFDYCDIYAGTMFLACTVFCARGIEFWAYVTHGK